MMKMTNNTNKKLILIFILAAILRITPNIYLEIKEPGYHSKNINEIEFYYDDVARSVIAGKGFVHSENPRTENEPFKFKPGTPFHFVPPLYAWWLSLIYFLFGPNVLIGKILQCFMDASVCLIIFRLARKIKSEKYTALFAALLYAVYPLAIYMSMTLYYQVPLNLIICWMILNFASEINFKNGCWTGISTALSALAKPVTLPLFLGIPAVKIYESFRNKNFKDYIFWLIGFVVFTAVFISPWTIRNYLVFKRFVPVQSGAGAVIIQGSKEEYIDLDVTRLKKKYGQNYGIKNQDYIRVGIENHLRHFSRHPIDYIRFLLKKFGLAWYNTEGKDKNKYALAVQTPFIILLIIGFLGKFKKWFKVPNWYIPGMILYICFIQVALFPLVRYTLGIMPLVMIISAHGLELIIGSIIKIKGVKV